MSVNARHKSILAVLLTGLLLSPGSHADLLGHWQFNEQAGLVAEDSEGSNDGTLKGDASFVAGGITGNAIHMSRAGEGYVDFGDIFDFASGDFSLSIWAKSEPGDLRVQQIIVGRHVSRSSNGYFIGLNNFLDYSQSGKAWFYMSNIAGAEPISTTSVNDGAWHHLAATYQEGGDATLYIDGVAEASRPATSIVSSPGDFRVGGYIFEAADVSRFNGYVDELLVYNHVLSQEEVKSLYEKLAEPEQVLEINAGFNDAWYNPTTSGQGFLISVFPDIKQMFLAWFTFDVQRPPEDVTAILGEPGHRWLTAQGPYDGDKANLTIFMTVGGVFDAAEPAASTDSTGDGSLTLEFADCTEGLVQYEIISLGISGVIPIKRISPDNVALCETLANP